MSQSVWAVHADEPDRFGPVPVLIARFTTPELAEFLKSELREHGYYTNIRIEEEEVLDKCPPAETVYSARACFTIKNGEVVLSVSEWKSVIWPPQGKYQAEPIVEILENSSHITERGELVLKSPVILGRGKDKARVLHAVREFVQTMPKPTIRSRGER